MSLDPLTLFKRSPWSEEYKGYTFTLDSRQLSDNTCYMFFAPCEDPRNITKIVAQRLKSQIPLSCTEGSLSIQGLEREDGKRCIENIEIDYLSFSEEHRQACFKAAEEFQRNKTAQEIYTKISMDIAGEQCQVRMGDTVCIPARQNILIFKARES